MGERVLLHVGDEIALAEPVEVDGLEPSAEQCPRVGRPQVGLSRSFARVAFTQQPLGDLEHPHRVEPGDVAVATEGPHRERHCRVRPLFDAALLTARVDAPGAHVVKELTWAGGRRRLREGATDVDAGMVVATAYRDAALCLNVDARRHVELGRARAVARLPDREELCETAAVATA